MALNTAGTSVCRSFQCLLLISYFTPHLPYLIASNYTNIYCQNDSTKDFLKGKAIRDLYKRLIHSNDYSSTLPANEIWIDKYFAKMTPCTDRCIILIDNYFGKDLHYSALFPVLLRQLVPALHGMQSKKLEWIPAKFISTCVLNFTQTQIDFKEFTSRSKPWNCQVQVSLFPPLYVEGYFDKELYQSFVLPYKLTFEYPVHEDGFEYTIPSPVSPIHALILKPSLSKALIDRLAFWIWNSLLLNTSQKLVFYDIVMILYYKMNNSTYIDCLLCRSENDFLDTRSLYAGPFPNMGELLHLSVSKYQAENTDENLAPFNMHLRFCINKIRKRLVMPFRKASHRHAHALVHLWINIFRNYTYRIDLHHVCHNGEIIVSHFKDPESSGTITKYYEDLEGNMRTLKFVGKVFFGDYPQKRPLIFEDVTNSLKYIACGNIESLEGLPFKQLVNVYDNYVWFLIVFSGVSVVIGLICIHNCTSTEFTISQIEIVLKMFLEQDYNISFYNTKSKLLLLLMSFAALVIRNAWKNDNVYKMALPRQKISLETFEDLNRYNFTVYVRSSSIKMHTPMLNISSSSWSTTNHRIIKDDYSLDIMSEIFVSAGGVKDSLLLKDWTAVDLKVLKETTLHPLLIDKVHRLKINMKLKNVTKGDESTLIGFIKEQIRSDLLPHKSKILEADEALLTQHLFACNKTGVILPISMCNELERKLEQTTSLSGFLHMSTSETYFRRYYTFQFTWGQVPPYIFERAKRIQTAGLFDWWTKFTAKSVKEQRPAYRQRTFVPTTMGGNILTVFILMLVGQGISLLCLFLEVSIRLLESYVALLGRPQ